MKQPLFFDELTTTFNFILTRHDIENATALYTKMVELGIANSTTHGVQGTSLYNEGDIKGGIALLERTLEMDPSLIFYYRHLGVAYQDSGDLDRALDTFRRGMLLNTEGVHTEELAAAFTTAAIRTRNIQNVREAMGYTQSPYLVARMGEIFLQENDIPGLRATVEKLPNNIRYQYALGESLRERGEYAEAAQHFRVALNLHTQGLGVLNNKALARVYRGFAQEVTAKTYPPVTLIMNPPTLNAKGEKVPSVSVSLPPVEEVRAFLEESLLNDCGDGTKPVIDGYLHLMKQQHGTTEGHEMAMKHWNKCLAQADERDALARVAAMEEIETSSTKATDANVTRPAEAVAAAATNAAQPQPQTHGLTSVGGAGGGAGAGGTNFYATQVTQQRHDGSGHGAGQGRGAY